MTSRPIYFTVIDPKNGFVNLPEFEHIDLSDVSLDLQGPSNVSAYSFVFEFLPILASLCSLIYGLDLVHQAADIAFAQLRLYLEQTGKQTVLCLRDIYEALHAIKVSHFRLTGYMDAARTAFSLVLGKNNLFSCRKGLCLDWLFSRNTIINARGLTHELQCRVFLNYLIFWLYQQAKDLPECKKLRHVIVIDDALRFVGNSERFSNQQTVSQLGHMLAVLRSTGIACIFVSQLASSLDPAVISLSRNLVVIGNVNGEENLRVIQNAMSLTPDRKDAILRFQPREMLAFVSGSPWPYPVHGWAPYVADQAMQVVPPLNLSDSIVPWHALTEGPRVQSRPTPEAVVVPEEAPAVQPPQAGTMDQLTFDCLVYPTDKAGAHAGRMPSIREYDAAKTAAVQNGLLTASQCGKSLYLIPTPQAYEKFSQTCPFQRTTSMEHGFYVYLAAQALKKDHQLAKVRMETPIGTKGATIDVTTTDKTGVMTAYEVTLSTSNLISNAAKLQDTAYTKIVWLCRDAALAKAVQAHLNKSATLPEVFLARCEYLHLSKFIRHYESIGATPCQP